MQLWLGVHLPLLCLDVFRPKWSRETSDPAIGIAVFEKERVIAMDARAREAGVCMGMRRGGVLTLAPATVIHERDSAAEVDTVREVATGLLNLSLQVVIAEESTVLVDVSASLRLFGGIRSLRRMAHRVADAIGMTATVSVAPTWQAAWLLARARGGVALSHDSLQRALAGLPVGLPPPARRHMDLAHWHWLRNGWTTNATFPCRFEEALRDSVAGSARPRQWRSTRSVRMV